MTKFLLQKASSILIIVLSLSIFFYWLQVYAFVVFGSSAFLGMIFALYIPYLYTLPTKYGKQFSTKNTTNSVIAYAIGQAVMSAVVGYLMEWIHPLMLFISSFFLSIINKMVMEKTILSLEEQGIHLQENGQIELLKPK